MGTELLVFNLLALQTSLFNSHCSSMSKFIIQKQAIQFLIDLRKNNNRDYFTANKTTYLAAHENMVDFADALLFEMNKHDQLETLSGKKSLNRIYKDVRFSKEKTPYNTHWGGGFRRATKLRRGGYYFRIEPNNSFIACGFWGPNTDDLLRIRQDIERNYKDWDKLLKKPSIVSNFGQLQGEQLSSAPRGFSKEHPAINYLRYKQFLLVHAFTDEEVLALNFVKKCNSLYQKMRPFLDYMSELLTTDLNGESLL